MTKRNDGLRAECVRLRVEERRSLREIHDLTGAAKGSLSLWLKEYPLTASELRSRQATNKPKPSRVISPSKYYLMAGGLTSEHKGRIAEAAVLFRLVVLGYTPLRSVFEGSRSDWLIELEDARVVRLQVKWAARHRQGPPIQ